MKTNKLTKEEKKEAIWITIGRLRAALRYNHNSSPERMIELFDKIVKDVEEIDSKLFRLEYLPREIKSI